MIFLCTYLDVRVIFIISRNLFDNKGLYSYIYIFVYISATAGLTAGPNRLKLFRKPMSTLGVTWAIQIKI